MRTSGHNLGKIMNFARMVGINDKVRAEDMREWTGVPQTARTSTKAHPILSLNSNTAKLVAHHRKKTLA